MGNCGGVQAERFTGKKEEEKKEHSGLLLKIIPGPPLSSSSPLPRKINNS